LGKTGIEIGARSFLINLVN
jgi:hypothetical protein